MVVENRKFVEKRSELKELHKGGMAEWFKATDCKSVGFSIAGSNPASFNINILRSFMIEI